MDLRLFGRGITDLPCEREEDDLLGISDYAKGLASFIAGCPTPMSVAIQGDWGTGKTSVIHYVQNFLDKDRIKSVYFNTWQYSQFNMSDNLYFSFLACLLKAIGAQNGDGMNRVKETVLMAASVVSNVFLGGNGLSREDLSSLVKQREDMGESVAALKATFTAEIQQFLDNAHLDRLVVFVDDLDRLNPNVAVELLEVMKLFMDVNRCVFVLAIDYSVVVQGVRQKFGQEVSLAKCRSFFDKIIQLPFHMPVEGYQLEKMMAVQLPDIEAAYHKPLASFAKRAIGANPRTFKRLCNSFLLIQSVKAAQSATPLLPLDQAMLFCALCLQMNCPELHSFLASNEPWFELSKEKVLLDKEPNEISGADVEEILSHSFEKNTDVDWDGLADLLIELDAVLRQMEKNLDIARRTFSGMLQISGITSVTAQGMPARRRADATKITSVEVLGQRMMVTKVAQAIQFTFQTVLGAHPHRIEDCTAQLNILSREERSDSVFRSKVILALDGAPLYLGTSTGTADKMKALDAIADLCHLKDGDIRWMDESNCIYANTSRS